ncbi:alpha/beta fold hydrolase [Maricaulis salignorans]|uniref:alpha/beta fold hydrolase n=1 Tax=Maricaulis salignorans TaxID=144026 RepID=UPI003A8DFE6E
MRYRDLGAGPVLLLVHGWAASGDFFDTIADLLATEFRVVIPDLRAHGETPAGEAALDIDLLANDLQTLIDALELDDITALGWSMGATVLWQLIARNGHARFAGLIIEDMSPRILNTEGWALGMATGMDIAGSGRAVEAMRNDWPAYAAAFAPKMFARGRAAREPEMIADIVARLSQRHGGAMADFWLSMASQDLREALPSMNLPTLVISGARSEAYGPETSRYLVNSLPEAQSVTFANSGHAPHLEEPQEFASAVTQFANRVHAAAVTHHNTEGKAS